jgi:hypothetical protein
MSGVASFVFAIIEHARGKKIETWAFSVVGTLCLVVAFDQAWQDEHRNSQIVQAEKEIAVKDDNFWKAQSYDKDSALRSRDQLLNENYGVLATTQSSLAQLSNRLLDIAGPVPRKIDVMRWEIPVTYTFANVGKVKFWVLVVTTNKTISPIRGDLGCDNDFSVITENVLTHTNVLRADYTVLSPRAVHIEFAYPPVSAEHPLVFFATTQGRHRNNRLFV